MIGKMMQQGEASRGLFYHFFNNTVGLFTRVQTYVQLITGNNLSLINYGIFLAG